MFIELVTRGKSPPTRLSYVKVSAMVNHSFCLLCVASVTGASAAACYPGLFDLDTEAPEPDPGA